MLDMALDTAGKRAEAIILHTHTWTGAAGSVYESWEPKRCNAYANATQFFLLMYLHMLGRWAAMSDHAPHLVCSCKRQVRT